MTPVTVTYTYVGGEGWATTFVCRCGQLFGLPGAISAAHAARKYYSCHGGNSE